MQQQRTDNVWHRQHKNISTRIPFCRIVSYADMNVDIGNNVIGKLFVYPGKFLVLKIWVPLSIRQAPSTYIVSAFHGFGSNNDGISIWYLRTQIWEGFRVNPSKQHS